jgi:hypothetical protein
MDSLDRSLHDVTTYLVRESSISTGFFDFNARFFSFLHLLDSLLQACRQAAGAEHIRTRLAFSFIRVEDIVAYFGCDVHVDLPVLLGVLPSGSILNGGLGKLGDFGICTHTCEKSKPVSTFKEDLESNDPKLPDQVCRHSPICLEA